jgi:beta-galactosidase
MQSASLSAAGVLLSPPIRAATLDSVPAKDSAAEHGILLDHGRLEHGWLFHRGVMAGADEVWRSDAASAWQPVSLPHCFNGMDACDPDQTYFRGQGWYRTRIALRNPFPNGRTILHFQGAGQTTSVWVGSKLTKLIGTHKGGYDEFAFDITDAAAQLPRKERTEGAAITVLCDNTPDRDRIPSELSDFCLYGGLYRHVHLIYLPLVALDAVHVLPTVALDGSGQVSAQISGQVSIQARLYNPSGSSSTCKILVEVSDPQGRPVHQSTQTLPAWEQFGPVAEFAVAKPVLWSPESPQLYRCKVTLSTAAGEMSLEERFGIRHIEFAERGVFQLNGKRVLLRGTQRHADHAEVAAAMSDDLVREEMRLIREMGANFIRLGHYQQDRLVLELCDELGLMVWEELPWCRSGVGNDAFQQNARDMLTHMIEQHYNHPSVIFWGLGNEDDWPGESPSRDEKAIRAFMTEMRDLARQLDSSRLTALRRCEFARDIPDVYSPSIWDGWYSGNYRDYEQSLNTERERVKRFIHIEWGADSHAGRHSEDPEGELQALATAKATGGHGAELRVSNDGDWSESYACNLFDWHLKTQEKLEWLSGTAQWVFKDFASPLRDDNGVPRVNQKGVVERDLTKKESYFVFQSYWAEKPMVHIYGHNWPVRWGQKGELRNVHVYSNCEHAELFLNGVSQGVMQRDSQNFPAAGLRWNVAFAPGKNRLHAIATKNGMQVTDDIELIYQTAVWGKPAQLKLIEKLRQGKRVAVDATLLDEHGVLCLGSRSFIRFSLAGSGSLIDNLGTTRASRRVQMSNGRAEISLAADGACSIRAEVEGVPTASLEV